MHLFVCAFVQFASCVYVYVCGFHLIFIPKNLVYKQFFPRISIELLFILFVSFLSHCLFFLFFSSFPDSAAERISSLVVSTLVIVYRLVRLVPSYFKEI